MRYLSALSDWMTCLNEHNGKILLVSECENCFGGNFFFSVSLVCFTDEDVVGFWKLSKATFLHFLVTWNCANGSSITSHSFQEASDVFFVSMLFLL